MIYDVGTQYGDDIAGKIKQMIDNGCQQVVLVNPKVTPQEEADAIYEAHIIGIKTEEIV